MSDNNLESRYVTEAPTPEELERLDSDQRTVYDDQIANGTDAKTAYNFAVDLYEDQVEAYFAIQSELGYNSDDARNVIEDGRVNYVCNAREFSGELDRDNEDACEAIGRALIESFGSPAELGKDILECYFDYAAWARDVMLEGYQDFIEGANGGVYEVQL